MKIISNTIGFTGEIRIGDTLVSVEAQNHYELILKLLEYTDYFVIVSPYLFSDFSHFFQNLPSETIKMELITSFSIHNKDDLNKIKLIYNFSQEYQKLTKNWPEIHLDQKLHTKTYLFSKNDKFFIGIVSSANFTNNGLSDNHETGLLTQDTETLNELYSDIKKQIAWVKITNQQINKLKMMIEQLKVEEKRDRKLNISDSLKNLISASLTPSATNTSVNIRQGSKFFIKVSGVTDEPILPKDERKFDEPQTLLSFAKNPQNVLRIGDCLLEVAVGGMCFLSYYSCESAVEERTKKEKENNKYHKRWPYYIHANNLSLHYGKKWFKNPIYYKDAISLFKEKYPNYPVTQSGKDDFLPAIQRGHSYIRVTDEFGDFIIKLINSHK